MKINSDIPGVRITVLCGINVLLKQLHVFFLFFFFASPNFVTALVGVQPLLIFFYVYQLRDIRCFRENRPVINKSQILKH